MKVGLVVHPAREHAQRAAAEIVGLCRDRGHTTVSLEDVDVGADRRDTPARLASKVDLIVSVGGDGTLLRAALVASRGEVPVLGVNLGRLGFLTEVDPDDVPAALGAFEAGELRVEERIALAAEVEGADLDQPQWALNEIMVEKRARHRVIRVEVSVGSERVATYSGDGVIVATPTGSTAYSFSARGPIVSPRAKCLVVTPVSPHMVFDRSIVLAPGAVVRLRIHGSEPGLLAADGRRSLELPVGSRVSIRRAERPALLLRRKETESFYGKLRRKFSLPDDPRTR